MNKKVIGAGAGVLVLLGAGGAVYASTSHTSTTIAKKSTPASSKPKTSKPKTSTPKPTTPTKTQPVSAPVGFNATKTVFVLPFNLGDLPAPELAIAKANPAYAAGLANPSDWDNAPGQYYYIGPPTGPAVGAVSGKLVLTEALGGPGTQSTSPVPIVSTTFRAVTLHNGPVPSSPYVQVVPSSLMVQAAPVGTMVIDGVSHTAACVPGPVAWIDGNQIVTPPGQETLTAGPDVVISQPGTGQQSPFYIQGVYSCNGFS